MKGLADRPVLSLAIHHLLRTSAVVFHVSMQLSRESIPLNIQEVLLDLIFHSVGLMVSITHTLSHLLLVDIVAEEVQCLDLSVAEEIVG